MKSDLDDLKFNIEIKKSALKSCLELIEFIDNKKAYNDKIPLKISMAHWSTIFVMNKSAYSYYTTNGLTSIRNKNLREKINSLYTTYYVAVKESDKDHKYYLDQFAIHHTHKYFDAMAPFDPDGPNFSGRMVPNNWEEMIQQKHYRYQFKTLANINKFNIQYNMEQTIKELELILQKIDAEISGLDNKNLF